MVVFHVHATNLFHWQSYALQVPIHSELSRRPTLPLEPILSCRLRSGVSPLAKAVSGFPKMLAPDSSFVIFSPLKILSTSSVLLGQTPPRLACDFILN